LTNRVRFEIDPLFGVQAGERGRGQGERDQGHREPVGQHLGDRQADAVDGDRALGHDLVEEPLRRPDPHPPGSAVLLVDPGHLADRVGVPLDEVTVEGVADAQRQFQVHRGARRQVAQGAAVGGLGGDPGPEPSGRVVDLNGRHAGPVDVDRTARGQPGGRLGGFDDET
jgi:hypothetical protein